MSSTTLEEMGGARCTPPSPAAATRSSTRTGRPSPPPGCCSPTCPTAGRTAPARPSRRPPEREDWDGVIPDRRVRGLRRPRRDRPARRRRARSSRSRAAGPQEMVVGLARLDGRVVGLVANQPQVRSGAIFVDSADKAARFITLCDAFNIPLLFLHDVPGLHGRRRRRAPGHHPARREDDHRDGQRRGPEVLGDPAQVLRRRLLRHVRAGLRATGLARAARPP